MSSWLITGIATEQEQIWPECTIPLIPINLREDVLPALGLTVTRAAKAPGINRVTCLRVLHGKVGISVDLVLRPEAWLDGPGAESGLKG